MNKNYKIAIYAICKNEEQFVHQWIKSMWEADAICVLDTGSTDKTYDLLKEYDELQHQFKEKNDKYLDNFKIKRFLWFLLKQ